jgi:leucyl aminopeptidase (aminopeptidase T)
MNVGFVSGYLVSDVTLSTTSDGLTKAVLTIAEGRLVPAAEGEEPEAELHCVLALGPKAEELASLGRGSYLRVRYTLRRLAFKVAGDEYQYSQPLANDVRVVSAVAPGESPAAERPSP